MSDGVIYIDGYIEKGDYVRIEPLLKDGVTIVGSSKGGQAFEGFLIGELLTQYEDIHFVGLFCRSSCANIAMGAASVEGEFGFHLARFPEGVLEALPEEHKKHIPGMKEWLFELNGKIVLDLWTRHLTDEQIRSIVDEEAEKKLVSISFEETHYGFE